MRLEKIDGNFVIVLEDKDEKVLIAKDSVKNVISVNYRQDGLRIIDDKEIISAINEKGVYLLPIDKKLVNDVCEIDNIKLCDIWLDNFRYIFSTLNELVTSVKYNDNSVYLFLKFVCNEDFSVNNKDYVIKLNVMLRDSIVHEGISIKVNNNYLYAYLLANVFECFFKPKMKYKNIIIDDFYNGNSPINFFSNRWGRNKVAYKLDVYGEVMEDNYLKSIISNLINCHNIGASYSQVIEMTKNNVISNCGDFYDLSDKVNESIVCVQNIKALNKKK